MQRQGQLYILSAPSGCGKTTILKQVMGQVAGLAFSVSHTTRKPRSGEKNGIDYHFVTENDFQEMREQNIFLEWAEVHGNYYGTSRVAVAEQLDRGEDIILDIDVQGASIVCNDTSIEAVSVFVAPPSLRELEQRLRGRGTDSDEIIDVRLQNAAQELAAAPTYQYLVINDKLEDAVLVMQAIIIAERSKARRLPSGKTVDLEIVT